MIIYLPDIRKFFRNLLRRIWEWNARNSGYSEIAREICDKICKQPREAREGIYNRMMKNLDIEINEKMSYCLSLHRNHIIPKPRVWGR